MNGLEQRDSSAMAVGDREGGVARAFDAGGAAACAAVTDPVTAWLRRHGEVPALSFLGESDFVRGFEARLGAVVLTYRCEGSVLHICDVEVGDADASGTGAMREFVRWVRAIERDVPEIEEVHGLVHAPCDTEGDSTAPRGEELGAQLIQLYRKLGATCTPVASDGWTRVVYQMAGRRPSRH